MKRVIPWRMLALLTLATRAFAQDTNTPDSFPIPSWAFPVSTPPFAAPARPYDSVTARHVPKSRQSFTQAQVMDLFAPPDWHPETHPRMPSIVANGRAGRVYACAYCHLPDGQGRSENATLSGLPADYIVRQVADYRSRVRNPALKDWALITNMRRVADSVTDAEVVEAAQYFSRLRAKPRYKVVEASAIPVTYEAFGVYARKPGGGTEPLGNRMIEMSTDIERHELRDAFESFVTYVPLGSIARGKRIATAVKGAPSTACVMCHGPRLRGISQVPPLAGRSPLYMVRQLVAFRTGARAGAMSAPMQGVAAKLSRDEMIAVSAYVGSLRP